MALRLWSDVRYLPLLALSPAEMQALTEMPNKNKDLLLPFVHLRPWMSAHYLSMAMARIEGAYGGRPIVLDLGEEQPDDLKKDRPVFEELRALRDPSDGYGAWCDYVDAHPNVIPAVQLGEPGELTAQVARLHALGRGLAAHFKPHMLGAAVPVIAAVAKEAENGKDTCFVVDYGRQNQNFLLNQLATVAMVNRIREVAPLAHVAISASSFPSIFTALEGQDIFERQHFDAITASVGSEGLIYSDRGSARAERQQGGGGAPAPRIDYAGGARWTFFRAEPVEREGRPAAYVEQAKLAMKHKCWDAGLHVWGTQMIQRTANAEDIGIYSPQSSTAARINIHLHQQLFRGDDGGLHDTDEDWID